MAVMEQCKRKWYLRYIMKLYFDEQQPWSSFGLIIHEVAEKYKGEGIARLKELTQNLITNSGLIVHPDYRPKLPVALRNFKRFYDTYLADSQYIKPELSFYTDLTHELDITGALDVLYKDKSGEWVIVDYKTSKKKSEHSMQFAIYYYLLWRITGKKPTTIKCQIVYLSLESLSEDIDEFVDTFVLEHDDIRMCEMRIHRAKETIDYCGKDEEKWKQKPSALCNFCEYKKHGKCVPDLEKP